MLQETRLLKPLQCQLDKFCSLCRRSSGMRTRTRRSKYGGSTCGRRRSGTRRCVYDRVQSLPNHFISTFLCPESWAAVTIAGMHAASSSRWLSSAATRFHQPPSTLPPASPDFALLAALQYLMLAHSYENAVSCPIYSSHSAATSSTSWPSRESLSTSRRSTTRTRLTSAGALTRCTRT